MERSRSNPGAIQLMASLRERRTKVGAGSSSSAASLPPTTLLSVGCVPVFYGPSCRAFSRVLAVPSSQPCVEPLANLALPLPNGSFGPSKARGSRASLAPLQLQRSGVLLAAWLTSICRCTHGNKPFRCHQHAQSDIRSSDQSAKFGPRDWAARRTSRR